MRSPTSAPRGAVAARSALAGIGIVDAVVALAGGRAVQKHLDAVVAGREPAGVLDVELGGGGTTVDDVFAGLADDTPLVHPANADPAAALLGRQHGHVHRVERLEAAGVPGDA